MEKRILDFLCVDDYSVGHYIEDKVVDPLVFQVERGTEPQHIFYAAYSADDTGYCVIFTHGRYHDINLVFFYNCDEFRNRIEISFIKKRQFVFCSTEMTSYRLTAVSQYRVVCVECFCGEKY